jgi:hypothetical protein
MVEREKDFQVMPIKYYMPTLSDCNLREVLGKAFIGIQANLPFDGIEQYRLSFSTPIAHEAWVISEYFKFLKDRLFYVTSPDCKIKVIQGGNTIAELGYVQIDEIEVRKESSLFSISVNNLSNTPPLQFNIDLLISCTLTNLES